MSGEASSWLSAIWQVSQVRRLRQLVVVGAAAGALFGAASSGVAAVVVGTERVDVIVGSAVGDVLAGGFNNDVLEGSAGSR